MNNTKWYGHILRQPEEDVVMKAIALKSVFISRRLSSDTLQEESSE